MIVFAPVLSLEAQPPGAAFFSVLKLPSSGAALSFAPVLPPVVRLSGAGLYSVRAVSSAAQPSSAALDKELLTWQRGGV